MAVENQIIGEYYNCNVAYGLPKLLDKYENKIQTIYLDPPFFTGREFRYKQKVDNVGWDSSENKIVSLFAFSDKWEDRSQYVGFLYDTLSTSHRLLKDEGSIFLHLDYRFSSYARIILDEIFGEENFVNEIIWHYKSGGRSKKTFSHKHDTILFYKKTKKHYFNIEDVGIKRGRDKRNNMKSRIDKDGRKYWSIKSNGKVYKYYEDSLIFPSDVWDDIPHLHQKDPERTGYSTQKPEALLERIILSTSHAGDIIGDFFAGSGTTLAVAQRSGRRWIGMDVGVSSLNVCRRRLSKIESNGIIEFHYDKPIKIDFKVDSNMGIIYRYITNESGYKFINLLEYHNKDLDKKTINSLESIDYWAVGYERSNKFIETSSSYRTSKQQLIELCLPIPSNSFPKLLNLVDIYGRQTLVGLADYYTT